MVTLLFGNLCTHISFTIFFNPPLSPQDTKLSLCIYGDIYLIIVPVFFTTYISYIYFHNYFWLSYIGVHWSHFVYFLLNWGLFPLLMSIWLLCTYDRFLYILKDCRWHKTGMIILVGISCLVYILDYWLCDIQPMCIILSNFGWGRDDPPMGVIGHSLWQHWHLCISILFTFWSLYTFMYTSRLSICVQLCGTFQLQLHAILTMYYWLRVYTIHVTSSLFYKINDYSSWTTSHSSHVFISWLWFWVAILI